MHQYEEVHRDIHRVIHRICGQVQQIILSIEINVNNKRNIIFFFKYFQEKVTSLPLNTPKNLLLNVRPIVAHIS